MFVFSTHKRKIFDKKCRWLHTLNVSSIIVIKAFLTFYAHGSCICDSFDRSPTMHLNIVILGIATPACADTGL